MKQKRYFLNEADLPKQWYNIQADMVNKPMPLLNPATRQSLTPEDLYPLFAKELSRQELNQTDRWIDIPEKVREMYAYYRSTPLVRAYGLEEALGTPAHIYFKNESVSPVGSHKLNSALAQAYYCKEEGVTNVTTETGAGAEEYLTSLRMRHARSLLLNLYYSIAEVGELTGYPDANYFSRRFRLYHGVPPGVYRKNPEKYADRARVLKV